MKIAQINAQRSSATDASLEMIIREQNIDILYIQEPYRYKKKVRGYTFSKLKIIQPEGDSP